MASPKIILLFLPLFLIACAHPTDAPPSAGSYVRGSARVISIEPENGHALLEFQGRRIDAYWQTETYLAQGGSLVQNDPLKPPVGQYAEPVPKAQTLNAKAGDTITFIGISSPSGILLRAVAVAAQ